MVVLDEEQVLHKGEDANWKGHEEAKLDPLPHLVDLLLVGVGGLGEDLLLPGETGLDLGHGLLLHLGLRPSTGNGLDGPALASAGEGRGGSPGGSCAGGELRWQEGGRGREEEKGEKNEKIDGNF